MDNKNEFIPDPNAAIFGSIAAFQVVLRSLILEHPNPRKLVARMHLEKETTLATLISQPFLDAAIDAFESSMEALMPSIEPADPTDGGPRN